MLREQDAELKLDIDDPARHNPDIMPVGTIREFMVRISLPQLPVIHLLLQCRGQMCLSAR